MATKLELLAEADSRGLLQGQNKVLFDEAVKRGLVDNQTPPSANKMVQQDEKQPPADADSSKQKYTNMRGLYNKSIAGDVEAAATLATGVAAEPVAGIAGLGSALIGGAEAGKKTVEKVRDSMTYKPRSEGGKAALGGIAKTLEPVASAMESVEGGLGDFTFELTGSPTLAAMAASAPTAIGELIGLKGLRSVRKGTRLIDAEGRPTLTLKKALDKNGLDYDGLSPDVKATIPETMDPGFMTSTSSKAVASEGEKILAAQIKAGGTDDALAGLKLQGGRVVSDPKGNAAIKQGFSPGFVQSVKTSSPATKNKMSKMSNVMKQAQKSERRALDARPSDITGNVVTDRIKFIRDKASDASKELSDIAKNKLAGKKMDITPISDRLTESLGDLDVTLIPDGDGIPRPSFDGSLISKDRSSQRVIRDLVSLMAEDTPTDALRFHKMKKQLDIMIDFNKKSSMGLSDAGKGVLKDVRRSLNDQIRLVDDDYARVNDVLSSSLTALGDLDGAVGSIDIFGTGADKALGTRMRSLMSNQQGRIKMENAIGTLDETVQALGGKTPEDLKTLVMFADGLDSKFGPVAKTSFSGQVKQGIDSAAGAVAAPKASIVNAAAKEAGRVADRVRGINDFNAFESIDSLLK